MMRGRSKEKERDKRLSSGAATDKNSPLSKKMNDRSKSFSIPMMDQ